MERRITILFLILLFVHVTKGMEIQTPLEKSNFVKLSGYSEMMKYLNELDSQSNILTISMIGKTVQGREIPALYFSLDKEFGNKRNKKPVVLIYCQQHGDEPSGKEAALIIAREISIHSQDILNSMDLILVPQVNPDGAEMGQRRNANDMDLNRNHAILSEPESNALHRLFLKWMPDVTLDVHEYNAIKRDWITNGFVKDAEEMIGGVTNLNIAPQIISFSRAVFIPEVGKFIREDGFNFSRYIVGAPFDNQRIRHSTTAINDGRQSMGIYNTLSFIIEGKRYGDLLSNIKRRAEGQVSAITAFLSTVAHHNTEILKIVRSTREELQTSFSPKEYIYVQMDYFPDSSQGKLTFPVFDLYTWHHIDKQLGHYEPQVKPVKSVLRPYAYVIPKKQERIIELFRKHEIVFSRLKKDSEVELEVYIIRHVTPGMDEDKPSENVDVTVQKEVKKLKKGDAFVLLNQPAANLIPLLLEPQSTWSLAKERCGRKYQFSEFLSEGKEYPIYRLIEPVALNLEAIK